MGDSGSNSPPKMESACDPRMLSHPVPVMAPAAPSMPRSSCLARFSRLPDTLKDMDTPWSSPCGEPVDLLRALRARPLALSIGVGLSASGRGGLGDLGTSAPFLDRPGVSELADSREARGESAVSASPASTRAEAA
eukprot:1914593-Pyramimonas_sp.AAC.1